MPTVLRCDGFEFVVYFDDHSPPHVHVFKAEGETKIELDPMIVVAVWGMKKKDERDAKRITMEQQTFLLEKWRASMARSDFDKEYDRAVRAAALSDKTEPRAAVARYDRRSNRIIVELRNGASFLFPPDLLQGLGGASAKDLATIEITASGEGLRWPSLDADFSLPGLMMGMFGSKGWMAEFARRGGSVTSAAKAASSRANGRKGGRPRKKAS